jgi:hypothetical protein
VPIAQVSVVCLKPVEISGASAVNGLAAKKPRNQIIIIGLIGLIEFAA